MKITDEMIDAAAREFWPDGITYKTERRQAVRTMLDAAFAALRWEPVSAAPRDGSPVLLACARGGAITNADIACWVRNDRDGGFWRNPYENREVKGMTHWLRVPLYPTPDETERDA